MKKNPLDFLKVALFFIVLWLSLLGFSLLVFLLSLFSHCHSLH